MENCTCFLGKHNWYGLFFLGINLHLQLVCPVPDNIKISVWFINCNVNFMFSLLKMRMRHAKILARGRFYTIYYQSGDPLLSSRLSGIINSR